MTLRPAEDEDHWVLRVLERTRGADVPGRLAVGPGHDCAAFFVDGALVVVTTDVLVDGVHFDLARDGAAAAARKALLVNLSDLAAAAASPLAFEVGVVLPRHEDPRILEALADGFTEAARAWDCPLAGGDTNVGEGPLVLAVTAFGRAAPTGVVTRAGARAGDRLSVTGPLGGSLLGRHLAPFPRLDAARALARLGVPHAMMDLSDGLSRDLPRLCRASGVGARVMAARVPVHKDARRAGGGRSPLEHALHDGEDFELLLAHAPLDQATRAALAADGVRLFDVGEVVPAASGIRLVMGSAALPLVAEGYDHFARPAGRRDDRAWSLVAQTPEATRALGRALGRVAPRVAAEGLVVSLEGELGAGKTVLVKGVAEGLGVPPEVPVVSPTFTIVRSYDAPGRSYTLNHVDAYRLDGADDLENAGFEDCCGKGRLACVEWGGRVEDALPEDRIDVVIEVEADTTCPTPEGGEPGDVPPFPRRLAVRARGPRSREALAAWRDAYDGERAA